MTQRLNIFANAMQHTHSLSQKQPQTLATWWKISIFREKKPCLHSRKNILSKILQTNLRNPITAKIWIQKTYTELHSEWMKYENWEYHVALTGAVTRSFAMEARTRRLQKKLHFYSFGPSPNRAGLRPLNKRGPKKFNTDFFSLTWVCFSS